MYTILKKNESDNTRKSTSILVIAEHSYYNQHLKQKNYKYNKSIFFHNRFRDKQQFLRSHVKNALNNWMWYETKVSGNKKENWNIEGTKWKFYHYYIVFTSDSVISLSSQIGELLWSHTCTLGLTSPWWWSRSRSWAIFGCIADSWL